jgi:hypothetical protein
MKTFKHLSFVFFFSTIILSTTYGQSTWRYDRPFPNPDSEGAFLYVATAEISENRTLATGLVVDEDESAFTLLTMLDDKGNVLLDSIFTQSAFGGQPLFAAFYVQPIPNSNTFMVLSSALDVSVFIKTIYDYNFTRISEEIIYNKQNIELDEFVFKTSQLTNGNILITTPVEQGMITIVIAPDGAVVDIKRIKTESYSESIVESFDSGKFYAIGEQITELDSTFFPVRVVVEETPYPQYDYGLTVSKFSGKYVSHYLDEETGPVITTYDNQFNVEKIVASENPSGNEFEGAIFNSLVVKDSFLFTSFTQFDEELENSKIFVRKYDKNLSLISETVIFDPALEFSVANIQLASDGGIYLTIFGYETFADEDQLSSSILKLDGNGRLTSATNPELNIVAYTVFPNPSSGIFNITAQNIEGEHDIKFYDQLGRKVYNDKLSSSAQNTYDLSGLSNGNYTYTISQKSNILVSGQWIKN